MKVVLPVAGAGVRMRPMTQSAPKCLLPIAGGTILGHILKKLEKLSVSEYIFIIGYFGEKVEEYIKEKFPHLPVRFVKQENPQGLGEAIYLCSDFFDDEPLLIILGDTLFEADFSLLGNAKNIGNILYIREVADPKRFGVAKTDKNGNVEFLVEKPAEFVSNKALVGIYAISDVKELGIQLKKLISGSHRTRGEFQLTDALQNMLESGCRFKTNSIDQWLDCGTPEILLESNRYLLEQSDPKYALGENTELINCKIGSFVSVGDNCKIENSTLENCIVAENCVISGSKINNSILCKNSQAKNFHGTLLLGDYSIVCGNG